MVAFLDYASSADISRSGEINPEISNKSFSGLGVVALRLESCVNPYIHDLDFDDCLGCIYLASCSGTLRIENIRSRKTGDGTIGSGHSNILQINASHFSNIDDGINGIRRIVGYGGDSEDMISVIHSGGIDADHPLILEDIHLQSPLPPDPLAWASGSGTGMNIGDGEDETLNTDIWVRNSTILNAGQIGLSIYRGTRCKLLNNIVYGAVRIGSNVGLATPWNPAFGFYTGDNEVSGNRVWWKHQDGYDNPYYGGDDRSGVIEGFSPQTNVFQDETIDPADLEINPDTMIFGPDVGGGPEITSELPYYGKASGGTRVLLTGTGFLDVTSVEFDGVPAEFMAFSDEKIYCTTPPHEPGIVEIVLS